MSTNKYKVTGKFPLKDPSTKNVIDLLYTVFSFKLINEYFINYIILLTLDSITKKKSNKKIIKYHVVIKTSIESFFLNHLYWSILESNYKDNKNNLLLQKKVHDTKKLAEVVDNIISSIQEAVGMKSKKKNVEKIRKDVFKKLALKKIMPFLEKNHLPPLASNDAFKTHKIKEKKVKNIVTNEDTYEYYLYRENDIISKIPISYLSTGFQMKRFKEGSYVSVNLRQSLLPKYLKLLKKRYNKKSNFSNAAFYLLTYYNLNGFLFDYGEIQDYIPKIKNKKLEKLYSKSTELIGTPLTVPEGKEYFGLFPDIEQHFGSKGSFYDIEPVSGVYSLHLPLSYVFIKDTMERVEKWLGAVKSKDKLTFLLWFSLFIPDVYENVETDISHSILTRVFEELVPILDNSKYAKEQYYYLYDKKATEKNASHLIFVLSN